MLVSSLSSLRARGAAADDLCAGKASIKCWKVRTRLLWRKIPQNLEYWKQAVSGPDNLASSASIGTGLDREQGTAKRRMLSRKKLDRGSFDPAEVPYAWEIASASGVRAATRQRGDLINAIRLPSSSSASTSHKSYCYSLMAAISLVHHLGRG